MEIKEIIDVLRVCADGDIICPACPRYERSVNGGSAACFEDLMMEAADAIESQQKRIAELEAALREQEKWENRKPLPAFLAPMDRYEGLKRKFLVFKSDMGEMIKNCFVLRPDKDPAAVAALRAYAEATDNDTLSADIINWVGCECNDPLTLDELRNMRGEAAWIAPANHADVKQEWMIYVGEQKDWGVFNFHPVTYLIKQGYRSGNYGKTWLAYRSKPKE